MISFEVKQGRNKQWRSYIKGANNKKLFTSEQYHNRADAIHALKLVGDGAEMALEKMQKAE